MPKIKYPTFAIFFAFILWGGLLALVNDAWLYDPFGAVDQWSYLGFLYRFPSLHHVFPGHAAGEILGLLVPNQLVYILFPPLVANFLIDMLSFSLTSLAIYLVLEKRFGFRTAVFTILLFTQYTFFLTSTGSNYPEGRVMLYLAWIIWALDKEKLYVAGMVYGLMFCTAVASLIHALPILTFYFATKCERGEGWLSSLHRHLLKVGVGVLGVLALAYVWSLGISVHQLPMKTNFAKLLNFVGGAFRSPPLSEWMGEAYWLFLPGSIFFAALLDFTMKRRSNALFAMLFANVLGLSFVQFGMKQWPMQLLYFHHTLPIFFLALGALAAPIVAELSPRAFRNFAGVLVLLAMLTLQLYQVGNSSRILQIPAVMLAVSAAGCIVLLVNKWTATLRLGVLVMSFALLNIFGFSPVTGSFLGMNRFLTREKVGLKNSRANFEATLVWCDFVNGFDPQRRARLWYNENTTIGNLIRQLSAPSHLYQDVQLNRVFPSVVPGPSFQGNNPGVPPQAGMEVLIIDPAEDAFEKGRAAMRADAHLDLSLVEQAVFEYAQVRLHVFKAVVHELTVSGH